MEAIVLDQAGKLALQGTGWLVAVLLGAWSFYLFMRLQDSRNKYEVLIEKVVTIAESSKAANEKTATILAANTQALDTTTRAVQDLAREAEGEARETRHGLNNLGTIVGSVTDALRRMRSGGDRE